MNILHQVLSKIREEKESVLLITMKWPTQPWFPDLLKILSGLPWPIPLWRDFLSQANGSISVVDPLFLAVQWSPSVSVSLLTLSIQRFYLLTLLSNELATCMLSQSMSPAWTSALMIVKSCLSRERAMCLKCSQRPGGNPLSFHPSVNPQSGKSPLPWHSAQCVLCVFLSSITDSLALRVFWWLP